MAAHRGWKGAPTAADFCAAMKDVLQRNDLGSALYWTDADTLTRRDGQVTADIPSGLGQDEISLEKDHEFAIQARRLQAALRLCDPDWQKGCLRHLALYICHCLRRSVTCTQCLMAVQGHGSHQGQEPHNLTRGEDLQEKQSPPYGLMEILKISERVFKTRLPQSCLKEFLPQQGAICQQIATTVVRNVTERLTSLFPVEFEEHFFDHELGFEVPHVVQLVKQIVAVYFRLRLYPTRAFQQQFLSLSGRRSAGSKKPQPSVIYSDL